MHESSVNFVTSFCDATFKPVQSLNKIETNQEYEPRSDGSRCSGTHGFATQMLTAGIGTRSPRIAGRTRMYPTRDRTSRRRATAFCLSEPGFPYQLRVASARNLDVHFDTSDRTRPRSARHPWDGRIRRPHAAGTITCFSGSYNHYAHLPRRSARRWRVAALRPAQVLQQQMAGTAFRDGKWLCKGRMSVEMEKNGSAPCR